MRVWRLLSVGTMILLGAATASADERPNIVLIMADDMGYETVEAYGGQSYETPRLNELAETGMRFDQAHSTPVCTPTRVQLMSGRYNSRNYTAFGEMDPEIFTFGNLFQDAGYATFIGGKWQLGGDLEAPYHFGFDEYCLWQLNRRPPRYPNPRLEINGRQVDFLDGEYGPDVINDHVNDFIRRHQDEPFFVYYPMNLPHWPFEPTPDSPDWDPTARRDQASESGRGDKQYFDDMIAYVDKMVGQVVDHLDDLGLREETLVLFTADNGTAREIESKLNGRTVTGGKLSSVDSGTHVPLIANWPGTVPAGEVNDELICFTYFFPTIAEIAGIEPPAELELDGISFASQLRGEEGELRDWLYMWWYRNNDPDGPGDEFARTHRYKHYRDGRFYDLANDLQETNPLDPSSLSDPQQQTRKRLGRIIQKHTRPGFYDEE